MGLAGRQMVIERHSSDRMVNELKHVYGTLLERARLKATPV